MVRKTVAQLVEQPCRQVAGSQAMPKAWPSGMTRALRRIADPIPAGQVIHRPLKAKQDTVLNPRPALPVATAQGVVSLGAGVREESRQARLA
ncbi:hypothetical protein LCGC14_0111690 [marine sediment metagenome]|uniref:Uncharacterized protein n=1 Tax=marine sediment metagenome TaxID=412755 RepID=A0A0F9VPJ1_9ZZZZ